MFAYKFYKFVYKLYIFVYNFLYLLYNNVINVIWKKLTSDLLKLQFGYIKHEIIKQNMLKGVVIFAIQ